MRFTILKNKKPEPIDRFTLFENPYKVTEPHGDFTSIVMWSSVEPDGSCKPSSQYFKSFRASEDLMRINPEFFMLTCDNCGEKHHGDECQDCCEHSDIDDGHCLECGMDRTEDLMCRAHDDWKDRMQDGE